MRRRETPHLHAVRDEDLDVDLAVVAHARAIEEGLGGRAAMARAMVVAGVDELRADRDAARGDLAAAQAELVELRALRDDVARALADQGPRADPERSMTSTNPEPRGLFLLPPAPDLCQVCAVDHEPEEPHNPGSVYWSTARQLAGEPAPTWEDALAHVTGWLRTAWVAALAERGITVADRSES